MYSERLQSASNLSFCLTEDYFLTKTFQLYPNGSPIDKEDFKIQFVKQTLYYRRENMLINWCFGNNCKLTSVDTVDFK